MAEGTPGAGRREARPRRAPRRITPAYLERAALHYLERYATSKENLRQVLRRRVRRAAAGHDIDAAEAEAWIAALVDRFEAAGLVDDRTYAEARALSLRRRGDSARMVAAKLRAKGVPPDIVEAALASVDDDGGADAELAAAAACARRRRIGPFRTGDDRAACRERDLAALARNGFSYEIARAVIDAEDADDLEEKVLAPRAGRNRD